MVLEKLPGVRATPFFSETHKSCANCYQIKPHSSFGKRKKSKYGGLGSYCHPCRRTMNRKWWEEQPKVYKRKLNRDVNYSLRNKERSRNNYLLRNYGIGIDQYNKMLDAQGGKCAICEKHQELCKKSLAVDHCHKTKTIRSLLCGDCNTGIGKFKDDVSLLKKVIEYLRRNQ